MRLFPLNALFLSFLSFLLTSCGNKANTEKSPPAPATIKHSVIVGSIEQNVLKIMEDSWAEKCDLNDKEKRIALARILDAKKAEIQKFSKQQVASEKGKIEPFGQFSIIRSPPPKQVDSGWQSFKYSWQEIHDLHDQIKDSPINKYWLSLDSSVRAILMDDRNRVVSGVNMLIKKEYGPILLTMIQDFEACNLDPTCASVAFQRFAPFIQSQPIYTSFEKLIKNEADSMEDRKMKVESFVKRLKIDHSIFGFFPESSITRKGDIIYLPLSIPDNPELQDLLKAEIESQWNKFGPKIEVQWTKRIEAKIPNIYKILFSPETGGRPSVRREEKRVQLYNGTRDSSIGHELGHVLGLEDNYFTYWNPDSCEYTSEYVTNDIMSDSATGAVTQAHWDKILENYPSK